MTTREQVDEILRSLVGDKVDGVRVQQVRGYIDALTARCAELEREVKALNHHHEATQEALGLTGCESRPHSAYINELKAKLAACEAKHHLMVVSILGELYI